MEDAQVLWTAIFVTTIWPKAVSVTESPVVCNEPITNATVLYETMQVQGVYSFCQYKCTYGFTEQYPYAICDTRTAAWTMPVTAYCVSEDYHRTTRGSTHDVSEKCGDNMMTGAAISTAVSGTIIILLVIIIFFMYRQYRKARRDRHETVTPPNSGPHNSLSTYVTTQEQEDPPPYSEIIGGARANENTGSQQRHENAAIFILTP